MQQQTTTPTTPPTPIPTTRIINPAEQAFIDSEQQSIMDAHDKAHAAIHGHTITPPITRNPKPVGACGYIKPLPCANGWYCSKFTYGAFDCSTCSRRV